MSAAQTKEDEEEKHTGIRNDNIRKVGSRSKRQENRTRGVRGSKASRLCYKAEPGPLTVSRYLHSSSALIDSGIECHYSTSFMAVEPPPP